MKTRSPFLALVKFELFRLWHNFGTPGYLMWVLGFVWGMLPAIYLVGGLWSKNSGYSSYTELVGVWAGGWLFGWLFMLGFQHSFTLMRETHSVFPLLTAPNDHLDEFFGTRAVNPRILFRAKTLALSLVIIAPLLLNVVASFPFTDYILVKYGGEIHLFKWAEQQQHGDSSARCFGYYGLGAPSETEGFVLWVGPLYSIESKGSVPTRNKFYIQTAITRGPTVFAVWLIWAGVAAVTFTQGYYGLISKFLAKRSRRLATFAAALMPLASLLAIPFFLASDQELFHEAFICFAAYWLPLTLALGLLAIVVQRFCERRFAEQEVL